MPKLYVIPDPTPNAFATGRSPSQAAVAATVGLLKIMSREEIEGVLAHEMAHVINRDTLISTVAATLAGAISYLSHLAFFLPLGGDDDDGPNPLGGLLMLILAPLAATLIQMAVSRSREYAADATGARLVGYPDGLASALRKLQTASRQIPMRSADPATAHLFIVNPLSGGGMRSLFSTHPPMEERIRRLLQRAY
jgi:heat shock protein HtpX